MDQIQDIRTFLAERHKNFLQRLRSKGLDAPSAAVLRGSVRLLGETNLAYDTDGDEGDVVSEKDMTITRTITTPRKDRYGDVVIPRGCEKHLQNYLNNPQVFFGHKSYDLPIAHTTSVEIFDDRIRATAKFHEETDEARAVWRLVAKGLLPSTSIGFLPIVASLMREDEDEDDRKPRKDEDGDKLLYFDSWFPLKFKEWDLLEWSVVSVPANPDCVEGLVKYLSDGEVEGQKIPATVLKSMEPVASRKGRVWVHGFDPEKDAHCGVVTLGGHELEFDAGRIVRVDGVKMAATEDPPADVPEATVTNSVAAEQVKEVTPEPVPEPEPECDETLECLKALHAEMLRHHQVEEEHMRAEDEHNRREEELFAEIVSLLKSDSEPKNAPEPTPPQGPDWKPVREALALLADRQRSLDSKFFALTGRKP